MISLQQRRQQLLEFYHTAIAAVSGERATARFLLQHPIKGRYSLIAIGKAAAAMAVGAQESLAAGLREGLVITKHGHGDPRLERAGIRQLESAHPLPDESSLAAGKALLQFLAQLPDGEPLLFLLSGGASSLVEVLPAGMTPQQLSELNRWLLGSGLAIAEVNAIRKRLSAIKGGKLIPYLRGRPCLQLLLSDVPGDEMAVIGSGPLLPAQEPVPLPPGLPEWLRQLLVQLPQPQQGSAVSNIESHIIADNALARRTLIETAQLQGLVVQEHPGHIQGNAEELAVQFCEDLMQAAPGLYLWGGECSVVLPPKPGRGGRNQHLALAVARYLTGHDNILFLAAGSDGSDGPTEDAGALVDGGTVQRGEWEGLSAITALEEADAGSFLEASGDLIQTGPTGTNVMDLIIAWKW